ncbi:MAG: hypothetical protein FJ138_06015 [Deltaproteobacteria bacterium]|nr:hypothetical protein [Deltaproteobacteria bacterium]
MYVSPRKPRTTPSTPTPSTARPAPKRPAAPSPAPLKVIQPPARYRAHNSDQASPEARLLTALAPETREALLARLPALTQRNAQELLCSRAACMRCGYLFKAWGSLLCVSPHSPHGRCAACGEETAIPLSWLLEALSALMREPVTVTYDLLEELLAEGAARHLGQTPAARLGLERRRAARLAAGLPLCEARARALREAP